MVTLNPMFVGLWGPYPITMVFTTSTKSSLELHFQVQGEAPGRSLSWVIAIYFLRFMVAVIYSGSTSG